MYLEIMILNFKHHSKNPSLTTSHFWHAIVCKQDPKPKCLQTMHPAWVSECFSLLTNDTKVRLNHFVYADQCQIKVRQAKGSETVKNVVVP